ncbi:hypothetical protein GGI17_006551, partial [Coemansia sp. S146]
NLGIINANGVNEAHHIGNLGAIAAGMVADILAVAKTHWQEHDTDITPERRRKQMRLEQMSKVEHENSVPTWPRMMKKRDDEFRRYAVRV